MRAPLAEKGHGADEVLDALVPDQITHVHESNGLAEARIVASNDVLRAQGHARDRLVDRLVEVPILLVEVFAGSDDH